MKRISCMILALALVRGGLVRAQGASPGPGCGSWEEQRVLGITDATADYVRAAEDLGLAPARPRLLRRASSDAHERVCADRGAPWQSRAVPAARGLYFNPFVLSNDFNSGYANDRNNGARWDGRGLTSDVSGGLGYRSSHVEISVAPQIIFQQNSSFTILPAAIPGQSPFSSGLYNWLDTPQRFGDKSYWTIDPGDSYARVDLSPISFGVATQNMWLGPGIRNSILMSNTAPGFPHAFAGTSKPVRTGIGSFEAQMFWGRLSESAYFDTIPNNNHRLQTGLLFDYQPRWLPGLYVGFARLFEYETDRDGFQAYDLFPFFQAFLKNQLPSTPDNPYGNNNDNQMVSVYGRWVLPESGFEVYAEWARDDHSWDIRDFLTEPDHSQAWSGGFQKVVAAKSHWVRINGELIHLQQQLASRFGRPTDIYYVHDAHGHTNEGQLLGASVGPGADAQYLGVDVFRKSGLLGFYFERVRRDEGSNMAMAARQDWPYRHDVEVTGGLRQMVFVKNLEVGWSAAYSKRFYRNFGADDKNVKLTLEARWTPVLHAGGIVQGPRAGFER